MAKRGDGQGWRQALATVQRRKKKQARTDFAFLFMFICFSVPVENKPKKN